MAAWPYKHCPACGRYHDVSVMVCQCGADLSADPGRLLEEAPPASLRGTIDETIRVYQQICPNCATAVYLADTAHAVQRCPGCNKVSIRKIPPIPFAPKPEESAPPCAGPEPGSGEPNPWSKTLQAVEEITKQPETPPAEPDPDDWGVLLGETVPQTAVKTVSVLRAVAVNHGAFSAELRSDQDDLPLMLGRESAWAAHLQRDGYVSGKHCEIGYRDGGWYVHDNRAPNGTAVSTDGTVEHRQYLPVNGEAPLRDGDLLIFGHFDNSPAFRISVTEQRL